MRWLLGALVLLVVGCAPPPPAPPAQVQLASSTSVQSYFTAAGEHPDQVIVADINSAQQQIDAAIYSINRQVIVDALVAKHKQCNCVRVISDATQSSQAQQAQALLQLQQAGITVLIDSHTGIMHIKGLEVDGKFVDDGSFNWTNAASTVNDEYLTHINDVPNAQKFQNQFDTMWNNPKRFKPWAQPVRPLTPSIPNF